MSRPKRTCALTYCDRPHYGLGFCQAHYRQSCAGVGLRPIRGEGKPAHTCTLHPAGTATCYDQHCHCRECTDAKNRAQKRIRAGLRRRVDPTGTRRRLQALAALGWDDTTIADLAGVGRQRVSVLRRIDTTIRQGTAATIARVYDDLSMRLPADTWQAHRNRTMAARRGWQPPLAWDDDHGPHGIDNPNATPCTQDGTETTLERISWLADGGCSIAAITASLGVGEEAVEQACRRAGRLDLWKQLREAA